MQRSQRNAFVALKDEIALVEGARLVRYDPDLSWTEPDQYVATILQDVKRFERLRT